jgi:hypothetical protein
VRQSPAWKDVNTEAEKASALKAVTRQQLVKMRGIFTWNVIKATGLS